MGKYLNKCVAKGAEIRKAQLFKYMTSKDRYIPFESNASPNLDALSEKNCPGVKLKGVPTEMLVSCSDWSSYLGWTPSRCLGGRCRTEQYGLTQRKANYDLPHERYFGIPLTFNYRGFAIFDTSDVSKIRKWMKQSSCTSGRDLMPSSLECYSRILLKVIHLNEILQRAMARFSSKLNKKRFVHFDVNYVLSWLV